MQTDLQQVAQTCTHNQKLYPRFSKENLFNQFSGENQKPKPEQETESWQKQLISGPKNHTLLFVLLCLHDFTAYSSAVAEQHQKEWEVLLQVYLQSGGLGEDLAQTKGNCQQAICMWSFWRIRV